MPSTSRFFSAALFLVGCTALAVSGCSGSRTPPSSLPAEPIGPSTAVAEWNGETLTLDEFERAYIATTGDRAAAAADSSEAYRDFLDRYVNFRLKVQQAQDLGLTRDSATVAELEQYRDQLARPYFTDQAVLDDIVRDIYSKQQEEVRAAHLLLRIGPDAPPADTLAVYTKLMALRDSIVNGQLDFETAALRHSEDPSAQQNSGNLGYFTGGRMVAPFEKAAYSTPVGTISDPIRTRFGYHILHVDDRRPRTSEIRASHILIRIDGSTAADSAAALQTIEELKSRVESGEDFATLARQYSDDTGSGQQGGDLGFFGLGRMVPGVRRGRLRARSAWRPL